MRAVESAELRDRWRNLSFAFGVPLRSKIVRQGDPHSLARFTSNTNIVRDATNYPSDR